MARSTRHSYFKQLWIRSLENRVVEVEAAIRGIVTNVERRYEEAVRNAPADDDDEEEIGQYQDYLEMFSDAHSEANEIVASSLGALLVLIFSHVEAGLKQIWIRTRCSELPKKPTWPQLLELYKSVGIDLRATTGYDWVNAANQLNNSFKHSKGDVSQRLRLPDGSIVEAGPIDFALLPYRRLARGATEFLLEADRQAATPACPRVQPRFKLEQGENGNLHFRWVGKSTFTYRLHKESMPFPLEVWVQDDGEAYDENKLRFKLVETRPEFDVAIDKAAISDMHVRCRYLNSRYESGPWSEVDSVQVG